MSFFCESIGYFFQSLFCFYATKGAPSYTHGVVLKPVAFFTGIFFNFRVYMAHFHRAFFSAEKREPWYQSQIYNTLLAGKLILVSMISLCLAIFVLKLHALCIRPLFNAC